MQQRRPHLLPPPPFPSNEASAGGDRGVDDGLDVDGEDVEVRVGDVLEFDIDTGDDAFFQDGVLGLEVGVSVFVVVLGRVVPLLLLLRVSRGGGGVHGGGPN